MIPTNTRPNQEPHTPVSVILRQKPNIGYSDDAQKEACLQQVH